MTGHKCYDDRFAVCQCRACTRYCSCVSTTRTLNLTFCPITCCPDYLPPAPAEKVPPPARLPKAEKSIEQLTLLPYK